MLNFIVLNMLYGIENVFIKAQQISLIRQKQACALPNFTSYMPAFFGWFASGVYIIFSHGIYDEFYFNFITVI